MIQVGIVHDTSRKGLGGHGLHLAFWGLPGVSIAALADSNPENLEQRMQALSAKKHYPDWRSMLAQEVLDVVVVCSRLPEEHVDVITEAVQRGCHVLCEKPLCTSVSEAMQLEELASRKKVHIAVAHLARHALVFRTLKKLLQDGAIGRILTFYGRGKEDHRGGGEDLLVLGTHILDLADFLFGRPESVYAEVSQFGRPIVENDQLPTAEPVGKVAGTDVFATFQLPGEIRGIFESRRGLFTGQTRMGVTIAGTEGCLSVRYDQHRDLRLSHSSGPPEDDSRFEAVPLLETRNIPRAIPLDYSLFPCATPQYFMDNNRFAAWDLLQAIKEKRPPLAGVSQARLSLEVIEAIYASAYTGQKILLAAKN